MAMTNKHPCTPDCQNRTATCHAECEPYATYEKAKAKQYEDAARISGYGSIKTAGKKRTRRNYAMEKKEGKKR